MTLRRVYAPYPQSSGSPAQGEPVFLVIGRIRRPHGVHGEMLMEVITHFPERIQPQTTVFVGPKHLPMRVLTRRWHQKNLLITFEGYSDREAAATLRNQLVYIRADSLPRLPDGEYFHHQLIGLRVQTMSGQDLGSLIEILETGANDVYVVRSESGKELLLPAIESVILEVDLDNGALKVNVLPGLL